METSHHLILPAIGSSTPPPGPSPGLPPGLSPGLIPGSPPASLTLLITPGVVLLSRLLGQPSIAPSFVFLGDLKSEHYSFKALE